MSVGVYSDNPGMRGLGASGAYGNMPEDMYLRKIEQTNMYEDPMQVENHIRGLLVDFKPDKPFLASDVARHPDDRGGGFHSKRFLNLRHHGVAGAVDDPYLPDGTFLDHEFTERDPRGTALGPNMRKHYEQQMARASYIKFYDDNDLSVPEQGINPEQMVSNIKSGMYMFKDRYKNFATARGGWHNGGTGFGRDGVRLNSDVGKYSMDGTILDLTEAKQGNRHDAVAKLSADTTIAPRHSTPDHRFKIAKYGTVRVKQSIKQNDWTNNRQSVFQDHNTSVAINGIMANKQLANLIIDLDGIRKTKQVIAQGADYGDSRNNQIRSRKIHPDDIYKIFMITGSQPNTANQQFEGMRIHRYGPVRKHNNREAMENVQINHHILESMQLATKASRERDVKDLREQIAESAANNEFYIEVNNRQLGKKGKGNRRDAEDNRHIEDTKEVKTYAGIMPSKTNRVHEKIDVHDYGKYSLQTKQRHGKRSGLTSNNTYQNEYEQDRGLLDFGTYDRAKRGDKKTHMGRNLQYMRGTSGDFGDELTTSRY